MNKYLKNIKFLKIVILQIFLFVFFTSNTSAIMTENTSIWGITNPSMLSITYRDDGSGNKCRSFLILKDNQYYLAYDNFLGDAGCPTPADGWTAATSGVTTGPFLEFPDELVNPTSVARGFDYVDCEHIFVIKANRWAERLTGANCPYTGWTPVQDLADVPEVLGITWPQDMQNPDTITMGWDKFGRRHIYVFKDGNYREYTDFNRPYFYQTIDDGLTYSICTFFETAYPALGNLNCNTMSSTNYPPIISQVSDQSVSAGQFFNYDIVASDLDGDDLIWSFTVDVGTFIPGQTAVFPKFCSDGLAPCLTVGSACATSGICQPSWNLYFDDTSQKNTKKIYTSNTPNAVIDKNISIKVDDGNASGGATFNMQVIKGGSVITSSPATYMKITESFNLYAYDVEAYDSEGYYPLTYSWDTVPSGAFPAGLDASSINPSNGLIMGNVASAGTVDFVVTVRNSNTPPDIVTQSFTVEFDDNYCGNNVTAIYSPLAEYYEECDDGNTDPSDTCDTFDANGFGGCRATFCGDGRTQVLNGRDMSTTQPVSGGFLEECDDGNINGVNDYKTVVIPPSSVTADLSIHGSRPLSKKAGKCIIDSDYTETGIVDQTDGGTYSLPSPTGRTWNGPQGTGCSIARCGDGYWSPAGPDGDLSTLGDNEGCDDFPWGWGIPGDGCDDNCTSSICGDGVKQIPNLIGKGGPSKDGMEECDDILDDPTPDKSYAFDVPRTDSGACIIDPTNYNNLDFYGCVNAKCGDGYWSPDGLDGDPSTLGDNEACDDGNTDDADRCDSDPDLSSFTTDGNGRCSLTFCGDNVTQGSLLGNGVGNRDGDLAAFIEECDDGDTDTAPSSLEDKCDTNGINGHGRCTKTFCGDGVVQSQYNTTTPSKNGYGENEECDGLVGSAACDLILGKQYTEGMTTCNDSDCTFNHGPCTSYCVFDHFNSLFGSGSVVGCEFAP